ncbi:spermidine synthase [Streptomyces sp. P1-3]|uniref:spermidine synthase n=1 Tax=Streptomyces sp. P1-3 TaxID=3421658 RepID=UPI003D3679C6
MPAGLGRFSVLATAFICAACGLVYELELVALAAHLTGDSVTQASVVLAVMVFAMGMGSLLAKPLRRRAALGFAAVEALLALVGGGSAMALYASFAWAGESGTALVGFALAIGVLIGAEVPLLMTLIQRVRRQDAGCAVADLFAADYVGALVGGLAFPFLLLPALGQLTGALLTGAVNAVAGGGLVLWLFRRELTVRARWTLVAANVMVLSLLAVGAALTGPFESAARRAVYGADVRVAVRTGVQEIVLTGGVEGGSGSEAESEGRRGFQGGRGVQGGGAGDGRGGAPLGLYLDGRLRISARDDALYHEALVHPAMSGAHRRVLVLGGGDGLAAREVLRYADVASVTVLELDPGLVRLARTDPGLSALNARSLDDPRVRLVTGDAFGWLRGRAGRDGPGRFDVVISDLPGPTATAGTRLYSHEFYGLMRRALAPGGRLTVHAGSLCARPRDFWTVDATVRSVGLLTVPYAVGGARGCAWRPGPDGARHAAPPDWGFVLAGRGRPRLDLSPRVPPLRAVTAKGLRRAARCAAERRAPVAPVSTLMHPRYTG